MTLLFCRHIYLTLLCNFWRKIEYMESSPSINLSWSYSHAPQSRPAQALLNKNEISIFHKWTTKITTDNYCLFSKLGQWIQVTNGVTHTHSLVTISMHMLCTTIFVSKVKNGWLRPSWQWCTEEIFLKLFLAKSCTSLVSALQQPIWVQDLVSTKFPLRRAILSLQSHQSWS